MGKNILRKNMDNLVENRILDIVKALATFLIVGSHSLPIFKNNLLDFYYGQWLFRFCVPLFFISSGYFFGKMNDEKRKSYLKRIIAIYLIATLIYLPFLLKTKCLFRIILNFAFGYHHLWYLNSLFFGLIIIYFISKYFKFNNKNLIVLTIILLFLGIFFDEYYKIINFPIFNKIDSFLNYIGGGRNFLFFAIPMLLTGLLISKNINKILNMSIKTALLFLLMTLTFSFIEATILKYLIRYNITIDLSLFNTIPAIFIFIVTFLIDNKKILFDTRILRKTSDIIYIIHIWVIHTIRKLFTINNMLIFLFSYLISFIISYFIVKFIDNFKKHN